MNTKALLGASLAVNALLLGVEVFLLRQEPRDSDRVPPLVVCVPRPEADRAQGPVANTASAAEPAQDINWGRVETKYYRQYVDHLRSLGCPDQTIRGIIIADITELFRSRVNGPAYSASHFGP